MSNSTGLLNNTLWEQIGIQPSITPVQILMLQLRPAALREARLGALNTRSDRRASASVHLTHLPLTATGGTRKIASNEAGSLMGPCGLAQIETLADRSKEITQMQTAKRLGMGLPFLMSGCHLGMKASQGQVKRKDG